MTETLYISKENKETYSTDEVLLCFKNSDNLDEIKAYVEKAEERLYVAWASVDGIDSDNQKIPIGLVIKAQDELMKRGAPLQYRHTNKNVGKTLAYKVAQHPKSGGIGVLHLNMIYNGLPIDDEVWTDIVSGKLKGLSVGGQGVIGSKEYNDNLKSMVEVYSEFGQYETSPVENPANRLALNEAVSAVAKENKMAEEKKIQEVVKELSDVVSSLKEGFDELNSKVDNLKKEEAPTPEAEGKEPEVSEEEKTTEDKEVEKDGDSSISPIDALSAQVSDLTAKFDSFTKSAVEKEEKVEETNKEEEVVKEETIEETVTMEAPKVSIEKEESKRDIAKEYNDVMAKFQNGEATYYEVLDVMKGKNK